MSARLDGWPWVDNPRSGGGTYDPENEGYPWRIVLHTIEGRGFPNLATHPYPPQLWYDPVTGAKAQTIPLDRSGYALYQGASAAYYTNRARAVQIELVGFAEEAAGWPDSSLRNIAADVVAPIVRWIRSQGGDVDLTDSAVPLPGAIPNSAREDAPQRLAPIVWAFGPIGLCGHRHVPMGDDHWDAGGLDMRKIAAYAREILGGLPSEGDLLSALTPQEQLTVRDQLNALYHIAIDAAPGGSSRWADGVAKVNLLDARVADLHNAITGLTWNKTPRWQEEEARITGAWEHAVAIKAAVEKLTSAPLDYDQLARAIVRALLHPDAATVADASA